MPKLSGSYRVIAAVVVVTLLLAGFVVVGTGDTSSASPVAKPSKWLRNTTTTVISRLNPIGGDRDAVVDTPGVDGASIDVQDVGGKNLHSLVVDRKTKKGALLNNADPQSTQVEPFPGGMADAMAGGGSLYYLNADTGAVLQVDPDTEATIGKVIDLNSRLGTSVIDADGVLWAPVLRNGRVAVIDEGRVLRTEPGGTKNGSMRMVLVGGEATLVDQTDGSAIVTVSDGRKARRFALSDGGAADVTVGENNEAGRVVAVDRRNATLLSLSTDSGTVTRTPLQRDGRTVGAPVAYDGKVYVPDLAAHEIAVYDPVKQSQTRKIPVRPEADELDLEVEDGLLWINDAGSTGATVIDPDGEEQEFVKYKPEDLDKKAREEEEKRRQEQEKARKQQEEEERKRNAEELEARRLRCPTQRLEPDGVTCSPEPKQPDPPGGGDDGGKGNDNGGGGGPGDGPGGGDPGRDPGGEVGPDAGGGGGGAATPPSAPEAGAPGSPAPVDVTVGDASVTVRWSEAAANGSPIDHYELSWTPDGDTIKVPAGRTDHVVRGLTNGRGYTFTVVAVNGVGPGAPASSVPAKPIQDEPAKPANVVGTAGDESVSVAFEISNSAAAPPEQFEVVSSGGEQATGTASPIVVTGLTNGQSYTFTVQATNRAGVGLRSDPSAPVTPRTGIQSPPSSVTCSPGVEQMTVSWPTAPRAMGYRVYRDGALVSEQATLSLNQTGLQPTQTYAYGVSSVSVDGVESARAGCAGTPQYPPLLPAPSSVSAASGQVQAVPLSWSGVAGAAEYIVTWASDGRGAARVAGTSVTISVPGMQTCTMYSLQVASMDRWGRVGPKSAAASATTGQRGPPTVTFNTGAGWRSNMSHVRNVGDPVYANVSDPDGASDRLIFQVVEIGFNGTTFKWSAEIDGTVRVTPPQGEGGESYIVFTVHDRCGAYASGGPNGWPPGQPTPSRPRNGRDIYMRMDWVV